MCLISVKKHRSIDLFLWEAEFVVGSDDLDLIWKLMSAELISLKQIDGIDLRVDVEVPGAEDIVPQAVDGLVGTHRIKGIQVTEQASNCQSRLDRLLTLLLLFHFR